MNKLPIRKEDWKKIEKNNLTISLNVLYIKKAGIIKIILVYFINILLICNINTFVYISKHNSIREKQVILITISNGEGWHYIAVKQLPALLREITSKNHGYFHCLNCLHSFRTENKLN